MAPDIEKNYHLIQKKLEHYPHASLIAVSKRQPLERLLALSQLGHRDFGENYLQEWQDKKDQFPNDMRWHFIGQLQSRKIKQLVNEGIHSIHSIGSNSGFSKAKNLETFPKGGFFLQVNLAEENQKGGFTRTELEQLDIDQLSNCMGLMCIPPAQLDQAKLREHFQTMKQLNDQMGFKYLSMGMSSDWELALDEGSTHIRVGSALFGSRDS